jgi:hypothetical protein
VRVFRIGLRNSRDLTVNISTKCTMASFRTNKQQNGSDQVDDSPTTVNYYYIHERFLNADERCRELFCHLPAGPVYPKSPCLTAQITPFVGSFSTASQTRKTPINLKNKIDIAEFMPLTTSSFTQQTHIPTLPLASSQPNFPRLVVPPSLIGCNPDANFNGDYRGAIGMDPFSNLHPFQETSRMSLAGSHSPNFGDAGINSNALDAGNLVSDPNTLCDFHQYDNATSNVSGGGNTMFTPYSPPNQLEWCYQNPHGQYH